MAESFIGGEEYTVAILGDQALPAIKIVPATDFYNFEAKYLSEETQFFCPCGSESAGRNRVGGSGNVGFPFGGRGGVGACRCHAR